MSQYRDLPVSKLKKELAERGAVTSGRKVQLIERTTRCWDWPVTGFQQLQIDHKIVLPKITREQIDAYFLYRLAGDREASGDIKALVKGQLLHDSRRVMACSVHIREDIYLTGIVGAAMKNKVSYNYKLKLEKKTGDPLNSHCECPAGKGPHGTCKHLAAVLILLQEFASTGVIKLGKSCTDNLQTFHKPKKLHKGSPIKTENLNCHKRKMEHYLGDPRPEKFRRQEGFNDRQAVADHDYCSLPFTEYWVDRAIAVNTNDISKIEKDTRGQSSNKVWFDERRWRLTASMFGDICRITERRNVTKLCKSLCGEGLSLCNQALIHGKNYEKKALMKFEEVSDMKTKPCGFFVFKEKPFLGASPDAVIDGESIVEVKCPFKGRNEEKIIPGKYFKFLIFDNEKRVTLRKSSKYYDQIQGQLLISQRQYCYFVVYIFHDLFVQKILFDKDYCYNSLLPKLESFYSRHFRPFIAKSFY